MRSLYGLPTYQAARMTPEELIAAGAADDLAHAERLGVEARARAFLAPAILREWKK